MNYSSLQVRLFYEGGLGTSMFSDKLIFSAPSTSVPDAPGVPFGGGFYAGANIIVDGVEYALVVAPKSQGEYSGVLQWKTTNTITVGADSPNNGRANTAAMIANSPSQHPAADFCNNLSINGYNDWHLPSRDELEICYRYLKPGISTNLTAYGRNPSSVPPTDNYTSDNPTQTSAGIFQRGGVEHFFEAYYWTSTQSSSTSAEFQYFDKGTQLGTPKTDYSNVRAVRWVKVE